MFSHIIDEQDRQAFRRFLLFNKWTLYSPCMIIGDSWSWIELGCPFAHTTYSETENKLHLNLIKIWSPSFLAKIFCQKSRSSQKIADFRHTYLLTLDSLYATHVTQFQDKNEASTYPAAYWFSWGYFNYQDRIQEYYYVT